MVALAAVGVIALAGAGTVAADERVGLNESTITVNDGGAGAIVVESDGVESFEVVIGDEDEVGYGLRATVTPDGDGGTALTYDHGEAGVGGDPLTATGAEVELDEETDLGESPAPGAYEVNLFIGDGSEPADVGTLTVDTGGESGDRGDGNAVEAVRDTDVEDVDLLVEPRATVVTVPVELDDGAAVEVRLRSAGNASTNYIKTRDATVTDGEATATINASVAEPGERATLTVRGNEELGEPVTRDVLVVDDVDSPETGDTGGEAPGFGFVAAGLGVLGAALVARVRG
ncbi:hypothetical protein EXE40_02990 [Halorubrum sp. GN11GM_10-3_MGM]|nr:hypothetical protein EXE40_02990 [Halorubrum sp. GN11GM_10-3_MGM]